MTPSRTWAVGRGVPRPRLGSLLVMMPVLLVLLLTLGLLAVDVGRFHLARSQLQGAADAAAMSAAATLGHPSENALVEAGQAAGENKVLGQTVVLNTAEDVTYGTWDPVQRKFTPLSTADRLRADSVRVIAPAYASRDNPVRLLFGPFVGIPTRDAKGLAIAFKADVYSGIVGIDWVSLSGNPVVDSYSPGAGSYASTQGSNAVVMSNGPISIGSNVTIKGDARPGPGYTTTGGTVTRLRAPLPRPIDWPVVTTAQSSGSNDNASIAGALTAGSLVLSGSQIVTLGAGTYVVKDLTMTGQSQLKITGPVTIYVKGTVKMAGIVTTTGDLPDNLKIRVIGGGAVDLSGTADLYANVYAPESSVNIAGTHAFFGTFVGKTMTVVGTAGIHHDQTLRTNRKSSLVQ